MTTIGNNDCIEYKHDESQLRKINNKIANLKNLRCKKILKKRLLKKKYNRLESKKENLINELHWRDFYMNTAYNFPDVLNGQIGKKNNRSN